MAFKGDLKNVHLADLFQTLSQNQQEGVLTIAAAGQEQRVHFHGQGITLLNPRVIQRRRLGDILTASGLITEQQLDEALKEQGRTGRAIGETVVGMGLISPVELDAILRVQVEEELFELFRIQVGSFEFREGSPPDGPPAHPLQFQVDGIVLEAARRMDEWSLIQEQVPELTRVYSCTDPERPEPEDQEARVVLQHLDGRRSVQDAADALLSSPFAVAKVIAGLLEEGRIREATANELMDAARTALAEGNRTGAAKLLNLVRQMDLTGSEHVLPELAHRLREVEDGRGAAQVRLRLARLARDRRDPEAARRELESALEDQPGSHAVLTRLVEVLADLEDASAELDCIQKLLEMQPPGSDPEEAIRYLERALELSPEDLSLHRQLSDYCLRARLKDKAIEVLERELELLRSQGKPERLLIPVYKRILHIDGSRADIDKALRRVHVGTKSYWIRLSVLVTALLVTAASAWAYYSTARQTERDNEAYNAAVQLFHAEQYQAARSQVHSVLSSAANDDVLNRAKLLLDRVDGRINEIAKEKRDAADRALDEVIGALQDHIDQRRFDLALSGFLELIHQKQEPFLRDRTRKRLKILADAVAGRVTEVQRVAAAYQPPGDREDQEVEQAYLQLTQAFPPEDSQMLARLQPIAGAALQDAPEDCRAELNQIAKATDSWFKTDQRMQQELVQLGEGYRRAKDLQSISMKFYDGMEAAGRGELAEARRQLAMVLEVYGQDGTLTPVLQGKIDLLDEALAAVARVEELIGQGDLQEAHQLALQAIEQYEEVNLGVTMRVPVLVTSSPNGALLSVDGTAVGRTPVVLRVRHDQVAELTFERTGFQPATFPLECVLPYHHQPLRKETLRQVHLSTSVETAPVPFGDAFYVSTREGSLYSVPIDPMQPVREFRTGSLGGSTSRPVPTGEGIVLTVLEGRVFLLPPPGSGEWKARWERDLEEELHYQPVEHLSDLVVTTDAGRMVFLDLITGNVVHETRLGARIIGDPRILGGLLYLPLEGGRLVCYDLGRREEKFRRKLDADLDGHLQVSEDSLVTCTTGGDALRFHPRSGSEIWRVPLGSLAIGGATLHEDTVDVCLGNRVVRLALADGQRLSSWDTTNLSPLSTRPVLSDPQTLLVGAEDGSVLAFIPEERTPFYRTRTGESPVVAWPVVTEGAIAVLCRDGTLTLLVH